MRPIEEKFPAIFDQNEDLNQIGELLTQLASLPKKFGFTEEDKVLIALPESEDMLADLIDECIAQKVWVMIPAYHRDTAFITQTIREEQVSVLVISSAQWPLVFQQLNAHPENITRMQVIVSDGKGEIETRFSLIPSAFSKAMIHDTNWLRY